MKHLLKLTNYKIIKKNFDNLKNSNVYICKKSKKIRLLNQNIKTICQSISAFWINLMRHLKN